MERNDRPYVAPSADASGALPRPHWTPAGGFAPDPERPELNAAIYDCMEAFRLMTVKGGDEIEIGSLGAFGASLHACSLEEVRAYAAKFRAFTDALPKLKTSDV